MKLRNIVFGLAIVIAGTAQAQNAGVVTLRANQTSGTGSLTPVLTWSTNPAAVSCSAGGGWSGTKAVSGTQTLPAISTSTNYTLTCSWGGDSATLSWVAPATNTDGSVLSDLAGFKVLYGTSATTLDRTRVVNDVTARTTVVPSLAPGTWYFAVRAVNSQQRESDNSNIGQKTVTSASASGNVTITIAATPTPPPPPPPPTPPPPTPTPVKTLKTTGTVVYDVTGSSRNYRRGNVVGSISLGRPCDRTVTAGSGYYKVARGDVRFTRQSRSTTVVARCASS